VFRPPGEGADHNQRAASRGSKMPCDAAASAAETLPRRCRGVGCRSSKKAACGDFRRWHEEAVYRESPERLVRDLQR
jgi:hypothetical protein